jgi:hypothetical protein
MTVTLARWLKLIGQLCLGGDPYTVCGHVREANTGEASTVEQAKHVKGPGSKGANYGWFNVPYKHEFDAKQLVSQLFAKLEAKSVKIVHTWAAQKRRFIEQNIVRCIQYTADVPLLRLGDLSEIDEQVARCIKHIMQLPSYFPIYAVYLTHLEPAGSATRGLGK